jgi:hypothetical protein
MSNARCWVVMGGTVAEAGRARLQPASQHSSLITVAYALRQTPPGVALNGALDRNPGRIAVM